MYHNTMSVQRKPYTMTKNIKGSGVTDGFLHYHLHYITLHPTNRSNYATYS